MSADVTITGRPLASCPFCGSDDLGVYHRDDGSLVIHLISCEDCGCDGPEDPSPDEARRRWNGRS